MPLGFCGDDADEGVEISDDGGHAECFSKDAWLGARGRPGIVQGAFLFEVQLKAPCLMRVGWAALTARRTLGTDRASFAYGGTAKKSSGGKFEDYGAVHEGKTEAVIGCLLDRRHPDRQTISFKLNGENLGVAFRLPAWLADVPLFPAICGREDWVVDLRFSNLKHPEKGYRPLAEAKAGEAVQAGGDASDAAGGSSAADELEKSRLAFSASAEVTPKELQNFDVPDENLLELRSDGDETLELSAIRHWLRTLSGGEDIHVKLAESHHVAVVALQTHRTARAALSATHTLAEVSAYPRSRFSIAAEDLLEQVQPKKKAKTDRVARRFIAAALTDDPVLSKEQLKQLRGPSTQAAGSTHPTRTTDFEFPPRPPTLARTSASGQRAENSENFGNSENLENPEISEFPPSESQHSVGRRPPPAPPMPSMEGDDEDDDDENDEKDKNNSLEGDVDDRRCEDEDHEEIENNKTGDRQRAAPKPAQVADQFEARAKNMKSQGGSAGMRLLAGAVRGIGAQGSSSRKRQAER